MLPSPLSFSSPIHIMDLPESAPFDPDNFQSRPRRHTDQPRPLKPTVLPALTPRPTPRPRTRSFNNVNASLDYSGLSLVSNGSHKVQIKTTDVSVDDGRTRRSSGVEASKRVLQLAAPHKRAVYTKDLDLVDTKVKLSHLRVQWPLTAGERQSKSTTRVRVGSPEASSNVQFPAKPKKTAPSAKPAKPVSGKSAVSQRCVSEEKQRYSEPDSRKAPPIGPSACKSHSVDLLLVRQYNEAQQHLLATIRDLTSGKWEQHSILRSRMQEFAPWAACELPSAERMDKVVHFV